MKEEFKLEIYGRGSKRRYAVVQAKNSLRHIVGERLTEQGVHELISHGQASVTIVPAKK